jgi:hypothetical protein
MGRRNGERVKLFCEFRFEDRVPEDRLLRKANRFFDLSDLRHELAPFYSKRILKLDRLWLRGPLGAREEFLRAAIAQNLRKLAKAAAGRPITKTVPVAA